MNVKLGNCACVVWPNTRNLIENWFLHSFCNFPKSNAFGEDFIRTKFILRKIFFQMSILSNRRTLRMFFNLCWKNCEKSSVGGHDHFEGEGVPSIKNKYKFFCEKWCFEYFSYNNFFKKKNTIFSKITVENNFWGHDHFSGNWVSDDKNEYNFYEKWGTKYCFEIFSSTGWVKAKKTVLVHIFPHISGSIRLNDWIVSKKKVFTCTNRVNFMKIGSKLRPVSRQ